MKKMIKSWFASVFSLALIVTTGTAWGELPTAFWTWDGSDGTDTSTTLNSGEKVYTVLNKYIDMGQSVTVPANGFTFSFWTKRAGTKWRNYAGFSDTTAGLMIQQNNTAGTMNIYGSGAMDDQAGDQKFNLASDPLQLVTFVSNAGTLYTYVNGELNNTFTPSTTAWPSFSQSGQMRYFALGSAPSTSGTSAGNGGCTTYIADARIYNQALTEEQVKELYDDYRLRAANRVFSGSGDWLATGAWKYGNNQFDVPAENAEAFIYIKQDSAVNMNAPASLTSLTIDGSSKVAFNGESALDSETTTINTDTDVSGITASLGATTIASGKTLTVGSKDTVTSVSSNGGTIEMTVEADFSKLENDDMFKNSGFATVTYKVDDGTTTKLKARGQSNSTPDAYGNYIVGTGSTLNLNGRLSDNNAVITLCDTATLTSDSAIGATYNWISWPVINLANNANAKITGPTMSSVASRNNPHSWDINYGTLEFAMNENATFYASNLSMINGGSVKITSGTLELGYASASAQTVALVLNGGTLRVAKSYQFKEVSSTDNGGVLQLNEALTVGAQGSETTYAGSIKGSGALNVVAGSLDISNATRSEYTGTINVSAGATLVLTAAEEKNNVSVAETSTLKLVIEDSVTEYDASDVGCSVVFVDEEGKNLPVCVDGTSAKVFVRPAAQMGSTYYANLTFALAAAESATENKAIILLADATDVKLPAGVTLNTNDKTVGTVTDQYGNKLTATGNSFTAPLETAYIAKIGDNRKFTTVDAAMAVAESGQTVTVFKPASDTAVTVKSGVTLDIATGNTTDKSFGDKVEIAAEAESTVKLTSGFGYFSITGAGTVQAVGGENFIYGLGGVSNTISANLVIPEGNEFYVRAWTTGTDLGDGNITVNGTIVNSRGTGNDADDLAVSLASGKTLSGTGTINAPVTFAAGSTLDASAGAVTVKGDVTIEGETVAVKPKETPAAGDDIIGCNNAADVVGKFTVANDNFMAVANGTTIELAAVAATVDGVKYTDFGSALAAAQAGQTIKLMADTGDVTLRAGVSLNTNGKTVGAVTDVYGNAITATEGVYTAPADDAYVAQIGGKKYLTFAEALTAANAMTGDVTVQLFQKVTMTSNLSGSYDSITFVGNTDSAEIYLEVQGYVTASGKKVAFTSLKLSKSSGSYIANAGFMNVAFGIYDVSEVTYTNCYFVNGAYASSGTVTFTGCTFKRSHDKYGLWAYGDVNCIVDNCVFDDYRGIKMYAEGAKKTVALKVTNTNFSALTDKPAIVLTYGESVELDGNTYSNTGTFELDLGGLPDGTPVTVDADEPLVCVNDNGACGVLVGDKIYTTVTAAAAAATAGDTVKLLHNSNETVVLPMGVTLNKNNYTADGVTVAQPIAQIGEAKYASLQAALNAAAAGTGTVTVEILSDIDLTGTTWTPVEVSAPGYPFVTVNGNNKTIKGLTDMLFSGTWAGKSGLVINDLTIADSTIVNDENDSEGNIGVGAFIGYPSASETITLNNCHLKNSTVKGGHWTGGLVGIAGGYSGNDGPVFMTLTFKDCSVTGSTITGKGSAGGVIGHAANDAWTQVVIENTTVTGNTITSTGSSVNKAGTVMGTIGAAGTAATADGETKTGGVSVAVTESGNTATSGGTIITTTYGRQGTSTGVLEITGGTYENNPIEEGVAYAAPAEGYLIEATTDAETGKTTYGLVVDPAYGKVAKIGDTYYETLTEAFAAVTSDSQTVTILRDVTEKVTDSCLRGNIVTENDAKVTITLTNTEWVYLPYTFVLGENVTLNVPNGGLFYYAGGSVIKGTVVTACYYQRYANTKLTIEEPGSMTVTTETFIVRYMDGDANAGIYIVGDNNDSTIGLKAIAIYFYQGTISATNANIEVGVYRQTNTTDGAGSANLILNNSKMNVTVNEHPMETDGTSTVTLTNGSNINVSGGYKGVAPSIDASSSITKNDANIFVAKIGDTAYLTLQAAFDAVQDGETITVLGDITFTKATVGCVDGQYVDGVRYTGDKSFIVDFNGKTVTDDSCVNDYLIYLNNIGEKANEITFKNGTILSKNGCWSTICVGANSSTQKTTLNLNGMTLKNTNGEGFSGNTVVRARGLSVETTVNVNADTTITSDGASYGATASTAAVLNINDGATIVQDCTEGESGGNHTCAALGGHGKINVNEGATITSDCYGIYTFTTGFPVVNVNGGTITATKKAIVAASGDTTEECKATVNISGGVINGELGATDKYGEINVSGGTFDHAVAEEFCAEGYIPTASVDAETGNTVYGVKVGAYVAQIGETKYETFAEALAAAEPNQTITLLADVTCSTLPSFTKGGVVNVDINGNMFVSSDRDRVRPGDKNYIKFVSGFGWEVYDNYDSYASCEGDTFRVFPTLDAAIAYEPAKENPARIYPYEDVVQNKDVTLRAYSHGTSSTICVDPTYDIVWDLNGYTVLQENPTGNPLETYIRGKLTLNDSSDAKTGKWIAAACGVTDPSNKSWYGNGGPAFIVVDNGELILNGGTVSIARNDTADKEGNVIVNSGGLLRIDSGKMQINDGVTLEAVDAYGIMCWGGDVTIDGGTFNINPETHQATVYNYGYYNNANVTINSYIPGTVLTVGIGKETVTTVNVQNILYYADGTSYIAPVAGEGLKTAGFIVVEDTTEALVLGDEIKSFTSFADAYAAAEEGETIVLTADIATADIIVIGKAITLDGNGYTLTSTAARAINVDCDGDVAIKNLTINASGERAINVINKPATLTIDNVTATAANYTVNVAASGAKATVTITNSDLTGLNVVNVAGADADVTISNTTITCNDQNENESYSALALNKDATNATITANGCTFEVKGDSKQASVGAAGGVITIDGTEYASSVVAIIEYGDYYYSYETLQAAIDAANDGQTVKLINNVESSEIVTINKAITLDGNGKTLTSSAARAINVDCNGDVAIKNLTINCSGERAINVIYKPANLTIDNVTATAANYTVNVAAGADKAVVTITNSDLTGLNVVNVAVEDAVVTITDTKLTCNDQSELENYAALCLHKIAVGAKITAEDCEFDVEDDSFKAKNDAEDGVITIDGSTDGVVTMVAAITYGDSYYTFTSLAAAIEFAEAGNTITLLRDISSSEIITINKAITLDGNGKTLTSTAGRAINVDCNGNVAIKNLTVNCSGERGINVITKPANLTIENCNIAANNYAVNVAGSAGAAQVAITGGTLTGLNVVNVAGADADVTISKTTITCNDQNENESYSALALNKDATNATITANGCTFEVKGDSKQASVGAAGGVIKIGDQTYTSSVVAIIEYGDYYYSYETLQAAIDAANDGQTVKLINNVESSDIIVLDKAITLDGNGKKLTSTATRAINVSGADGVTIKNLTIEASGERAINIIQGATNVTIDNVTATADNYAVNVASSAANAVVTVKNSDLTGLNVVNIGGAGANVTVTDTKLTNDNADENQAFAVLNLNKDATGGTITANDCTFTCGLNTVNGRNDAENGTITIDGSTDGVEVTVAYINYGNYYAPYTSLQAAIDAAEAGQTITLIRDISASDIITIDKAITLDGNGKTLTSTAGRAINVDCNGNVAIKNLTVNCSGERAINVIQKPANLTIDNVKATAANYTVNVATSAGAAQVAITNSTLTGKCTVNVSAAGAKVTIDSSTINCDDDNTAEGEAYAALSLNAEAAGGSIVATNTTVNVTEGSDSMKGRNSAEDGTVTIDGFAADVTTIVAVITYAGSDYYHGFTTLAEAIEFAKAGQTITLLRDIESSEIITINKAITLDGNGKTLTYTGTNRAIEMANNADVELNVTIANLKVVAANAERGINYNDNSTLTLNNVVVEGAPTYALNLPGMSDGATVVLNNSSLTGNIALNLWGENTKVTATDTAFISVDNSAEEDYAAIKLNNDGTTAATGSTVTITGGSITARTEDGKPSCAVENAVAGTVTIENYTDNTQANYTVVVGKIQSPVAVVIYDGADQFYTCMTLQGAVTTATGNANATVKLVLDSAESVAVNGAVVFNVNGKSYTGTVTLANAAAALTAAEGLTVASAVEGYEVAYENGAYTLVEIANVAKIGNVEYKTLQGAIDAATAGQTVQLIADVALTEMVTVAEGKDLTLDLNGKAITVPEVGPGERHIYALNNKGEMTITDTSAEGTGSISARGIYNGYNGSDTDETVNGAKMIIEGGKFVGLDSSGGAGVFNCAELIIEGGTFEGQVAAVNTRAMGVATINGGTFRATVGYAIQNNGGKVTIADAAVDAGFGAVGAYGGTTVIQDGSFLPTGMTGKTCHVVYVYSGANVTINGGTFKMNYPDGATPDSGSAVASYYNGTLSITGGTFTSHFDNVSPVELSEGSEITGGTFLVHSGTPSSHQYVTNYLADGYELNESGTVVKKAVAQIGETKYTSLQAAIDAATVGDTITLLENVALTETVTVAADDNIVLELNGKTVSMVYAEDATANHEMILNNGNLTIQDSVGGGKLSYTYTGASLGTTYAANTITSNPGSVLTVKSGTIENLTYDQAVIAYAIDGRTNGGAGDVTVNIEGGTITSLRQSIRIFANSTTNTGTLNISGGEMTGRVIVQNASANANKAALNITGGTFNVNTYKTEVLYVGGNNSSTIDIEASISGGTFNGLITDTEVKGFISGGTFTQAVPEDWCVGGFTPVKNESGSYGVGVLPDAEVSNLGAITVGEGDYDDVDSYYIYDLVGGSGLSNGTEPFDLSLAMNFTAKDTEEQAKANAFGHYTTDFFLTLTGIEDGSFKADDCYLAGYYPSYGAWVKIPLDGFTVENGVTYPVISSAGFDFKYTDICASVQQFICGIYLTPEVLKANPNLEVELTLGLAENVKAAKAAEFIEVDGYTYNVEDLMPIPELPTATVTPINAPDGTPLTFALNFKADTATDEQLEYYGDWYADFVLTITGLPEDGVTFNADRTGDGYLAGQYDEWSENWVVVPPSDVTLKNGDSIKIMEYAATLLGQSGLKLTYNDVYSFVKDFDCGVYFTPEFLAANPDMKVSLTLRMYETGDASDEGVVIGEMEEFTAPVVVAKIGDIAYSTLQAAIDAAQSGDTITVLKDIALTETVTVADKSITLDLNGKTVSGVCDSSEDSLIYIENDAALTVKDSATGGKLTFAQGSSNVGFTVNVKGALTLESGTIELTGSWNIGYAVDVRPNSWGTEYTKSSIFTMNGGNVVSSDGGVRVASSSSGDHKAVSASFVMNGGTIDAAWDGVFIQQSNGVYDKLAFTMNDGTIESDLNPIRVYGPAPTGYVDGQDCMKITLNGGTCIYTGTEPLEWIIADILRVGGGSSADTIIENGGVVVSASFAANTPVTGYVWVKIPDTETYQLAKMVYQLNIKMNAYNEPLIGFKTSGLPSVTLQAATNLENPEWATISYTAADDDLDEYFWVKPTLKDENGIATAYRFFKLAN